jgi:4-amino-4-deoxy-L-arabinose transferase-like glycosyltransferase
VTALRHSQDARAARLALAGVLLAGAIFRLVVLIGLGPLETLHGDEDYYVGAGRALARGEPYPDTVRPPGYPFFASLVFRMFGPGLTPLRIAQMAVWLVTTALLFDIVRRRFGWRAAAISGLVCAIHPTLVSYGYFLWAETLVAAGVMLMLWCLDRFDRSPQDGWIVLAGLVLGATALTREMFAYFVPVAAGWTWSRMPTGRLRRVVLLAGAAALVILPWSLRNYSRHGELVLISTMRWFPIAQGNMLPERGWMFIDGHTAEFVDRYFANLDELDRERMARQAAFATVAAQQPFWIVKKLMRNTYQLFSPHRTQLSRFVRFGWFERGRLGFARRLAWIEAAYYGAQMLAGIAALWLVGGGRLKLLAVSVILLSLAIYVLANSNHRFRVPLLPLFCLYIGPLVLRARLSITRARLAGAALSLLLFATIFLTGMIVDPDMPAGGRREGSIDSGSARGEIVEVHRESRVGRLGPGEPVLAQDRREAGAPAVADRQLDAG